MGRQSDKRNQRDVISQANGGLAQLIVGTKIMMDPSKLTVLVIDDNPNDAKLLYRHLEGIRKWEIDFLAFTTSVAAERDYARV